MNELEQYKERLSIVLGVEKICVFEVDLPHQLYTFFENAEAIFGVEGDVILKDVQPFCSLEPEAYRIAVSNYFSHPEDADVIENAFTRVLHGKSAVYEARMKAGDSEFIWCRIHATPVLENGKPVRMIGVITDITDMKEKTERLKKAESLDEFTGLYKKSYAISRIEKSLRQEPHLQHALLILDIDNFKNFNDTYGHSEGDKIIREVSWRLKNTFRKTDIIGRFGGDEFLIFIRDVENFQWLKEKLKNILRLELNGLTCTNSVGGAFYPEDGTRFDSLFKKADIALYQAKERKEQAVFYEETE